MPRDSGATENSKIYSRPEADELVPPGSSVSPWLIAAACFTAAWIALGALAVSGYSMLGFEVTALRAAFQHPGSVKYILIASIPIDPNLIEIATVPMVWLAFLRPAWSDSLLFSSECAGVQPFEAVDAAN